MYSNERSNVEEIQILLSDHSSDNFSDPCVVEKNLLVPDCANKPAIGDYMLVEFKTFPRKYYVRQITKNKDFEGDREISFMWKKRNVTEFFFPEVTDLASVKEKDIRAVLPAPKECGSTSRQSRQRSSMKFDYDGQEKPAESDFAIGQEVVSHLLLTVKTERVTDRQSN